MMPTNDQAIGTPKTVTATARTDRVETWITAALGVVALAGMLFSVLGALMIDIRLDDYVGVQHIELLEVLPYLFWFATCFGLLLARRIVVRVLGQWRSVCWMIAGAIMGKFACFALMGDLMQPGDLPSWLARDSIQAAAAVTLWLFVLMGAAAGAAAAWKFPAGSSKQAPDIRS